VEYREYAEAGVRDCGCVVGRLMAVVADEDFSHTQVLGFHITQQALDMLMEDSDFAQRFLEKLREKGWDQTVVGCTQTEIDEIQHAQNVGYLPPTFVQFLQIAGKEARGLWSDAFFDYSNLLTLKSSLVRLLEAHGNPIVLPSDAFVFNTVEGINYFYFLTATHDPDPYVYCFSEYEYQHGLLDEPISAFLLEVY
jgi:hypothetical protein